MRKRTSGWLSISLSMVLIVVLAGWGQAAGDGALVAAARDGDLQAVRALIAKRANINEPARDGSTALLWAAYHSNVDMVRALVAAGAKVDVANKYGITPLLQASRTGDQAVVQALLKAGASSTQAHPQGETPLMAAAKSGSLPTVRTLLESGADVNAADSYQQQTALMWAAAEGHLGAVEALLEAKADPNRQARVSTIEDRKHGDHPTGGFTALMFAARNGHQEVARALVKGGADPTLTNGDKVTALTVAIVNDRLDLAAALLDLGADANDGSLYFAVDMHDATTDMRAKDGSRLRADFDNKVSTLGLAKLLLERGADPNKAFVGQLHSTTLCCGEEINASPFFRAAIASDVEALTLMLAHGAKVEWSPTEVKKEKEKEGAAAAGAGRGMNANVGKTPIMVTITGGRGAAFNAGPGFDRLGPPPFREAASREPLEAVQVLLTAGADPNAKAPDGAPLLHQAVTAKQVPIIRALVSAGARLDAVNKDNLTALQLAEKPDPPKPAGNNNDPNTFRRKQDSREDVIAAVRQLMGLGPNDPTPIPPPLPDAKKDDKPADGVPASPTSSASATQ
jgi:ankyrin repeat protein